MKKTLSDVMLSAAKKLARAAEQEREPELLRCAQHDMSGPLFDGKS